MDFVIKNLFVFRSAFDEAVADAIVCVRSRCFSFIHFLIFYSTCSRLDDALRTIGSEIAADIFILYI